MAKSPEVFAPQSVVGDFAPKLVELTDDVLFGDIWKRKELSTRERSLITISSLITGGSMEQLPFHLNKAKENGITEDELIEVITHLAFYVGWPKTMSAIMVAKDCFRRNPKGANAVDLESSQSLCRRLHH